MPGVFCMRVYVAPVVRFCWNFFWSTIEMAPVVSRIFLSPVARMLARASRLIRSRILSEVFPATAISCEKGR